MKNNIKTRGISAFAAFAVLTTSALGLAACGGESTGSGEGDKTVVNIGTMDLVNGDLIAQYEKLYEEELGCEVNLVNFDSGNAVNTALASGSIDISELGSSPTALGISNDMDYEVFWVGDIIGSAESLIVKNSSGIKSVSDLKGKKVATPFASTAHYSLLNAMKLAGVSESDLTLLDMQPDDIYAAWLRDDIDAAYVWYPVLSELEADGTVITHSAELAEQGIITADLAVVRTEFAEEHPDIVTNYVKVQLEANDILNNDVDTAAQEIASVLEIDESDAAEQITQFDYLTADEQIDYLENKIPDALKAAADFLTEQGSIKSAADLETFQSRVTTEFIEAAAE